MAGVLSISIATAFVGLVDICCVHVHVLLGYCPILTRRRSDPN
jgi:hypothetical protein